MTWKIIRLELARTAAFPEGSPDHGYILHLPLDGAGHILRREFDRMPGYAAIQRFWPAEVDRFGVLIHGRRGWAFSYAPGEVDDETIFHLENHMIKLGDYLTITEPGGDALPFRIADIRTFVEPPSRPE